MSFSKSNTTANTLSTSATTNMKRGDSKTCTPFKPASNTNTSIANSKVQANAVRKPGQSTGLRVVTNAGNSPSTPVTADTVTSEDNTPASSVSVSISATAYPSDEENVRPAQDQEYNQAQAPLSPQLKDREGERDIRAYEHERQRSKRAEERAVRRARKAGLGGKTKVQATADGVSGRKREVQRRANAGEEVDGEYVLGGVGTRLVSGIPPLLGPATAPVAANERALFAAATIATPAETRVDVNLSDLVVPSRPAKSKVRTRTVAGEEFQWVPAVKAVIAIDEVEFGPRDMEVDEPWECVEAEAGETETKRKDRELSYADVLVGTQAH